jgi:hypothetical protein
MYRDESIRRELTENAHRDLISSGRYRYQQLIEAIDENLLAMGMDSEISFSDAQEVAKRLSGNRTYMRMRIKMKFLRERIRKWKSRSKEWVGDKLVLPKKSVQE